MRMGIAQGCNLLHKDLKESDQERHVLGHREELVWFGSESKSKLNHRKRSKSANAATTDQAWKDW
jgi:hypothetical protein